MIAGPLAFEFEADLEERRLDRGRPGHHDEPAALPDLLRPASGASDRALVLAELERLETSVQLLLKQEWDKSKHEARTGKLQAARA